MFEPEQNLTGCFPFDFSITCFKVSKYIPICSQLQITLTSIGFQGIMLFSCGAISLLIIDCEAERIRLHSFYEPKLFARLMHKLSRLDSTFIVSHSRLK